MPIDWDGLLLGPVQACFGESVSIARRYGPTVTLADAVLDRVYVQVMPEGEGAPVITCQTLLGVRLAAGPPGWAPMQGDVVTAAAGKWWIVEVQPDGKGGATCVLSVTP